MDGDYWLGLQNLHWLTYTAQYELRVDLEHFSGNLADAKYSSFQIAEEKLFFKLILGDYEGTAGDSLSRNNYMSFSTSDQDHDTSNGHCALDQGAWWHDYCYSNSNLNGLYKGPNQSDKRGMIWYTWENNYKVLKKSEIKIRHIG